jgi:hypothetical protein
MAKEFIYTGSQPHNATLRVVEVDENGKKTYRTADISLSKGDRISLPEDNAHIKSLVASGLLKDANPIVKK